MFRLTAEENTTLRSQNATSNQSVKERGGRRYLPFAFTEHGAISGSHYPHRPEPAQQVSVYVVRAFCATARVVGLEPRIILRLNELEKKAEPMALQSGNHRRSDNQEQFRRILQTLRELMAPPMPANKRPIGFVTPDE
jgi:hypothetical protein